MKRILMVLVAAGLAPLAAWAQSAESSWESLRQLNVGDKLVVVTKDKATHRGTFAALADDAISLRTDKGEAGYRRDDVVRVSRLGSARRGRAALIGLAIGAAVGAVVGAAAASDEGDAPFSFQIVHPAAAAAALAVVGGAAGAGVGAAVARPGQSAVYRAP